MDTSVLINGTLSGNINNVGGNLTITLSNTTIASYSGNANITGNIRTAILSGASFTLNLNSAIGNTGQFITFIHTGTSLTQNYSLHPFGGEQVDGNTIDYVLYTNGESLTVVSDNVKWVMVTHDARTDWIETTSIMAVTGAGNTGTGPVKAAAVIKDNCYWRRNGSMLSIKYLYVLGNTTGANGTAGTGDAVFNLPAGLSIHSIYTSNTSASESGIYADFRDQTALGSCMIPGSGVYTHGATVTGSASAAALYPTLYSNTQLRLAWPLNAGGWTYCIGADQALWWTCVGTRIQRNLSFEFTARHENWRP